MYICICIYISYPDVSTHQYPHQYPIFAPVTYVQSPFCGFIPSHIIISGLSPILAPPAPWASRALR